MPHFDFDAARRESAVQDETLDPTTFTLRGREFTCVQRLGIGVMLDLVPLMHLAEDGAVPSVFEITRLMDFLDDLLDDDSATRFAEAMRSKQDPIDIADIITVLPRLVEVATGRPTSGSSASADGPSTTGDTSTEPASEVAST